MAAFDPELDGWIVDTYEYGPSADFQLGVKKMLHEYRTLAEDAAYADLAARFTAALNTKPDDNSAAEAAVGYSLT